MGYYSKARGTEKLASMSISQSLTQITFPLYAEVQDDKQRLIALIKRLTGVIAYVTFPLMFVLILVAKPVFILLYSVRWLPSVPYFQILCIAGIAICLQSVNLQAISAIGKSKTVFSWTLIKRAIGLVLVIGGMWLWGIEGLLCGMVLSSWMMYLINAYLVSVHIGYKIRQQMLDLAPILLLSIIAFALSWGISYYISGMYMKGIVNTTLYIICYWAISSITKMNSYQYLKDVMPIFYNKFQNNKS